LHTNDVILQLITRYFEKNLDKLQEVFARIGGAFLQLNAKKCRFFQKQVEYLGHVALVDRIQTDEKKIKTRTGQLSRTCHLLQTVGGRICEHPRYINLLRKEHSTVGMLNVIKLSEG